MIEEVESLVVKVGMIMPQDVEKINYKVINNWKNYCLEYFKSSPNAFFVENEFFRRLPEKYKIKLLIDFMG